MGSVRDRDGAGLGGRLHARRDVGRIAENVGLDAGAFPYDYRTRIDADARGEFRVPGLLVELRDRVEDCEARSGGALGVIVSARTASTRGVRSSLAPNRRNCGTVDTHCPFN
jgi:hypothetical protein